MNQKTKINNADLRVGARVNVAVCERIFDGEGQPLSDSIIDTVDCEITEIGGYWSDQPHGQSGRYYRVRTLRALTLAQPGRQIILGI